MHHVAGHILAAHYVDLHPTQSQFVFQYNKNQEYTDRLDAVSETSLLRFFYCVSNTKAIVPRLACSLAFPAHTLSNPREFFTDGAKKIRSLHLLVFSSLLPQAGEGLGMRDVE